MKFNDVNICTFFDHQGIQFSIPAYQRAYSWEGLQTKVFLEDLLEHKNSDKANPYCYGNILLETIKEGKKYEIIDGQQRITTLSIFMRCLLNIFSERKKNGKVFKISDGSELDIVFQEDTYFVNHGIIKLCPTHYDKLCFDSIIIENKDTFICTTPSQERMLAAKRFFTDELHKLKDEDLVAIFETIDNARVNSIELHGKKESALMFELQNNRGKELTNLEKLKSFLMYQLYVYSPTEETDSNIEYVSNCFNPIYSCVSRISLQLGDDEDDWSGQMVSEDNILIYHSYAYSKKNFNYRNINDIITEFNDVPKENKVAWIKDYASKLKDSFLSIENILTMNDSYLDKLKNMKIPFFVYPFLIKGFPKKESLPKLFHLMEVISFRYKLINSRADIRGRLNDLIRTFDGDVELLSHEMKAKMEEAYYWSDRKFVEILNGAMYQKGRTNPLTIYFLWEYEQYLQRKGYIISGKIKIADESIEHISPQTEPDEKVTSGYEIDETGFYTKEFRENYINKLGNLMLISQSHNSSIGNNPFKDKLKSYIENPILRQQAHIKDFVADMKNLVWDSKSIDLRHDEMLKFACKRWSFNI